jgi:hypothetical protein
VHHHTWPEIVFLTLWILMLFSTINQKNAYKNKIEILKKEERGSYAFIGIQKNTHSFQIS